MKTKNHKLLSAGLGLLAALPAFAIEPPKDDAPPPPSVKTPASSPRPDTPISPESRVDVQTAFIGIISAEVPEMLATHLGIGKGEGILIRDLAPGGPAEKAGFSRFDVITRVAGKSVDSPAELSAQIASKRPDDEISVDFIHEGKAASKTVKLSNRPRETARVDDPGLLGQLNLDTLPQENADRLRDMIEGQLKGLLSEPRALRQNNFEFKSDATFRFMDNDGSVEMKSNDGKKEITVRDHQNNVVWSGPWATKEDKLAAPAEVRNRISRFKFDDNFKGNGFRFKMGPDRSEPENDE